MNPELKTRVVSGVTAATLTLITLFVMGRWVIFLVALALGMQGWREYSRMMQLNTRPLFQAFGYVSLFILFCVGFVTRPAEMTWILVLWISTFFLMFFEPRIYHFFKKKFRETDVKEDWTLFCRFILGQIYVYFIFGYIGPLASKASPMGTKHYGEQLLFLALMVIFFGDISAYFGGKKFGRRKLWPKLSPNKTVEGALSGWGASLVAAIVTWGILKFTFSDPVGLSTCVMVGFVCPPLAQASDFLESLMKRASNTKDSGGLLPGHGGILDRVDGFALTIPLIYYFF